MVLASSFLYIHFETHTAVNISIPQATPYSATSPLPTSTASPEATQPTQNSDDSVWQQVAANAWAYFQPGIGVDSNTGLPFAGGTGFEAFTDWDLAAYIQAIVDAQELGLVNASGVLGANWRIDKVLSFLENRPLNSTNNWPFWFYDATTGQGYLETSLYASDTVNIPDSGALLLALSDLVTFNSSYTTRVDNLVYDVYGNRSNYSALLPTIEADVNCDSAYNYYYDSGFARFWPTQLGDIPNEIMANIISAPTITTFNVTLPDAPIICEPLVLAMFQLRPSDDSALAGLMKQVYLANEASFNATGKWAATSEGSSPDYGYVYEWTVGPDGAAWEITGSSSNPVSIYPMVFTKIAYSFLALYNTTYAQNLVNYLQTNLPNPQNGYFGGIDTAGELDAGHPSAETNGIILDAALYYLQTNQN